MRFDLKRLLLVVTLATLTAAVVGARGLVGACFAVWLWAAILSVVAYRSSRRSWVVLALAMFLAGLFILPVTVMEGHLVPMWRLSRVRVGMNDQQLREILAGPHRWRAISESTTVP